MRMKKKCEHFEKKMKDGLKLLENIVQFFTSHWVTPHCYWVVNISASSNKSPVSFWLQDYLQIRFTSAREITFHDCKQLVNLERLSPAAASLRCGQVSFNSFLARSKKNDHLSSIYSPSFPVPDAICIVAHYAKYDKFTAQFISGCSLIAAAFAVRNWPARQSVALAAGDNNSQ